METFRCFAQISRSSTVLYAIRKHSRSSFTRCTFECASFTSDSYSTARTHIFPTVYSCGISRVYTSHLSFVRMNPSNVFPFKYCATLAVKAADFRIVLEQSRALIFDGRGGVEVLRSSVNAAQIGDACFRELSSQATGIKRGEMMIQVVLFGE